MCFPSDAPIYGIFCDGSKNVNIRTCEHVILGQLRMGARQMKNAALLQGPRGSIYKKSARGPLGPKMTTTAIISL